MKKIKLFALAAFALLSTNAYAQVGTTFIGSNGVEYEITKNYSPASAGNPEELGQVTVIRYAYSSQSTAIVIPEQVQNLDNSVAVDLTHKFKVVGINGTETANYSINTFLVNSQKTSKTISQPFKDCAATSVTLPATLMYIGKEAFAGFKGTTVVIPTMSNLVEIDDNAFSGAASLETFATANATWLATIGVKAFYGCAKLSSISLGAKLESIGAGAFVGTGITSLDLSACVLLNGTNGINRLFTGTGTGYVAADATNAKLTTVKLPTTNTANYPIAANAFDGCTKLATIGATTGSAIIPVKVASIGSGAFLNTAITKFDLSASAITAVGTWFSTKPASGTDLSKLQQIILKNNVAYTSFAGLTNISTLAKVGISDAEYTLPSTTSTGALTAGIFAGTALTQLDLSKITGLTTLPALFGSNGISTLTSVTINNGTTTLGASSFAKCTALETLSVKASDGTAKDLNAITTIGEGAFYRTKLASLAFGAALVSITKPWGTYTEADGAMSTATAITLDLSTCTALTNGGTAVTIPANSFTKLAALTSILLPTTLQYIGANAFEGTGITALTLPASIVQNATTTSRGILDKAFKDSKLTKLEYYPTTITNSIFATNDVFSGCSMVSIWTTSDYATAAGAAPTYSKWVTSSPEQITTVKDKVRNYAMKGFYADRAYRFDASECQIYEAYIDGSDIVMSPLRKRSGKYNVPANTAVIVRTATATTLSPVSMTISTSVDADKTSSILGTDNKLQSVLTETARAAVYQNYMYVLVNNATYGFSFQHFEGTKINKGNIFVINPSKAPSSSGRLNIVWLDENGNVESDATAIQTIEAAENENGAIYNLQGVRVNSAKKGLYIKNGKKFIVK